MTHKGGRVQRSILASAEDPQPRKVGIIINTPGQAHFYRYIYKELADRGHRLVVIARDIGDTVDLLRGFDIPFQVFSVPKASKAGKVLSLPQDTLTAAGLLKRATVDIVTGFGVYDAYSSALLGVPNVVFCDNEPKIGMRSYELQFRLFMPFVDNIITPSFYREDLGRKQVRIDGTKELAYLHPSRFRPDDSILDYLGVERGDHYSLLRFNSFGAFHDLGANGFTLEERRKLVRELERHGPVFISSEGGPSTGLEDHAIKIPKVRIHDALHFASLFVTDTQTMATEASVLGTPTIRCNSFVGPRDMGNFIELENRYRLMFNFQAPSEAIAKAIELSRDEGAKAEWARKREAFLKEKVDVTAFMTWFIGSYPRSVIELRERPGSPHPGSPGPTTDRDPGAVDGGDYAP